MNQKKHQKYDFGKPKRISIYIYPAQLQIIESICKKRNKTKRMIFFEAIQNYIGTYFKGDV
ncbi:MAG: hypothetical protein JXB26_01405 [Candidatus Aminicenantes bacterium]|nr:hypothetical protein [Candidatus Aminicenantes bacterium]